MALSQLFSLILIRWIENYPMDSAIRRLNKPGLGSFLRSCRFWGGGEGNGARRRRHNYALARQNYQLCRLPKEYHQ